MGTKTEMHLVVWKIQSIDACGSLGVLFFLTDGLLGWREDLGFEWWTGFLFHFSYTHSYCDFFFFSRTNEACHMMLGRSEFAEEPRFFFIIIYTPGTGSNQTVKSGICTGISVRDVDDWRIWRFLRALCCLGGLKTFIPHVAVFTDIYAL